MGNPKKILIVDDDPRNVFALTATLKARQFKCDSRLDARSAIELLRDGNKFDAILMDMMMPDMDGYEAIRIIREIPTFENLKIIAVTAQAMRGDREKCLDAGADDYISKPVNVDRLLSLLNDGANAD